jgi:pyridoxamine 5'-phosphate oxidase
MLESELDADPVVQFGVWFEDAARRGAGQPESVALATATSDGVPSVRMVLLKGWDEQGFLFFTNRESQKGAEMAANPVAAMAVYWRELGRQVRLQGRVLRAGRAETEAYFRTRSTESQVAAAISPQSRIIPSREHLDGAFADTMKGLAGRPVSLPRDWAGYRLRPHSIEFWEHQDHRLHDRVRYTRGGSPSFPRLSRAGWRMERLAP